MSAPAPKEPFDIDRVLSRLEAAVAPYPKAAMFELAELGYDTPFEQLIACIISIRTRDEASLPISQRLLDVARTPAAMAPTRVLRVAFMGHNPNHNNKTTSTWEATILPIIAVGYTVA